MGFDTRESSFKGRERSPWLLLIHLPTSPPRRCHPNKALFGVSFGDAAGG
jgi:hypothetical protein